MPLNIQMNSAAETHRNQMRTALAQMIHRKLRYIYSVDVLNIGLWVGATSCANGEKRL